MKQKFFFIISSLLLSIQNLAASADLNTYVQQEIAPHKPHVKKFIWKDQTLWFKRPETAKTSWHYKFLKNILFHLVPIAFLKPSPYTETGLLNQEVTRLRECEKLNVKCPRIIAQAQDWIIISDVGKPSEELMKSLPHEERLSFTIKLLSALQENHRKEFIHGRACLKDIFIDTKGSIYLIDFEENPIKHLSLANAKARDIFFFLFSVLPFLPEDDQPKLHDYLIKTLEPSVMDELLRIINFKPLFSIFSPLRNYLGKDPKRLFITLDFLYSLKDLRDTKR